MLSFTTLFGFIIYSVDAMFLYLEQLLIPSVDIEEGKGIIIGEVFHFFPLYFGSSLELPERGIVIPTSTHSICFKIVL